MRLIIRERIFTRNKQRSKLARYLWSTPVGWLRLFLEVGCPYSRGTLYGLGSTKTIFNRSNKNPRKQTVAECARTWLKDKKRCSGGSRRKIRKYESMLRRGKELEMIVTLIHTRKRYIIADGNHRAIAAYRAGTRSLPVEVIDIRWPRERSSR